VNNHELWKEFLGEASDGGVTEGTLEEIRRRVNEDTPAGYQWFFRMIRPYALPPFGPGWMNDLYGSSGRWANEAFRGSTKTSTITEAFTAYQIGLHPERSNGFAQASDDSVKTHAGNVADIIKTNPGWQMLFPNVVPDADKGWTATGYWVKDTQYDYGEWTRRRHKDPTLYAGSVGSAIHIGKHPTGVFDFDDINNDKNTESDRESIAVNRWVTDTMFPALENTKWRAINQTPWTRRDALALIKNTSVWKHTMTPVYTEDPNGVLLRIEKNGILLLEKRVKLAWPENFTVEKIRDKYLEVGEKGFARMYLCDLKAMEGINLKVEWLHPYPREQIRSEWPIFMGVDYASTADMVISKDPDYTTFAAVSVSPSGQRIVLDGFRGRLSQGEAEQKLKAFAMTYPTLQAIGVEVEGTGKEFYNLLARYSNLPIVPMRTRGKRKGHRFEVIMAPHFEFSRAWIAEGEIPFLKAFESEWAIWPNGDHDDTLDAVYYALSASGLLFEATEINTLTERAPWYMPQKKEPSPFAAFGKQARSGNYGGKA